MADGLQYIRDYYKVPAVRRARIRFTWSGWTGNPLATIVGGQGGRLKVMFDSGEVGLLHPTWEIEYTRTYNYAEHVTLSGDAS